MIGDSLRIGVVGLGKMGLLHASLLNVMPNVQLAGVCEKASLTRKLVKKVLRDVPVVEDVTGFSDLNLDAVFVTTPISSHFGVAKTVYEQRLARNLFVEKPLTSNYAESRKLNELSAASGGVNMVGYLRRFMVTFMKTKELLSQGAIGQPVSFEMNAFSSDFFGVHDNPVASIARGGVLRDLGSYVVDLALWFFGDLQLGSAETKSITGTGAEDSAHFTVHQKTDSLQGEVSISWCVEGYRMPEVNISIIGSEGAIVVNDDNIALTLPNRKKRSWFRHDLHDNVGFWLGAPEYYREDAYFIKAVNANAAAEPDFETASRVDSFLDAIQKKTDRRD